MFDRDGFVYAVEAYGDRIKIGWSADPIARIAALEREHGFLYRWAVVPAKQIEEQQLHARWSHRALGSEWFQATDAMRSFFEKLAESVEVRVLPPEAVQATRGTEA